MVCTSESKRVGEEAFPSSNCNEASSQASLYFSTR